MIKKLDILILRAFAGPFAATFLIALFVLVMQFFWVYLDDIVGKGLETGTLFYLIGLVAVNWVPLALPLSLLISSIMTFGNLGETFEIVAIKSAGIPLSRFMRPLVIFTIFMSGVAFLFANNIIPVAQLKLNTLKFDIIRAKPSFDIKEGVFYDKIQGYVIKLGKKEKDDSTIRNIVIYEKTFGLQDNLLIAQNGVMRVTADKKFIEFILRDGWRYEEKGPRGSLQTDFTRLGFKEYRKLFDLTAFQLNKTGDSTFQYDPKMLSVRQLNKTIDSLKKSDKALGVRAHNEVSPLLVFARYADTGWTGFVAPASLKKNMPIDSLLPDSLRRQVYQQSLSMLNSAKNNVFLIANDYQQRANSLVLHEIEWNRKFALSVACFVLFLIGAPLGAIIRKGGLGLPLVFAIIFFVVFHLLNTFGEKFARSGTISPFAGLWMSTIVLTPVGIFLTYKAMRDSQLFNSEFYFRSFKKLRLFFANFRR